MSAVGSPAEPGPLRRRALVEAGSPGSVEGGAGPSRLLVRARLHRKGFTAVDTFEFNGDGPGWALLPQPGPFVARSSDMVRAAIEGGGGPGAARTTIRRGLGQSGSVRPSFSRRPSPSPLPRLGAPV
jgi:hypothetical protein